jgi:hypothetical protein
MVRIFTNADTKIRENSYHSSMFSESNELQLNKFHHTFAIDAHEIKPFR